MNVQIILTTLHLVTHKKFILYQRPINSLIMVSKYYQLIILILPAMYLFWSPNIKLLSQFQEKVWEKASYTLSGKSLKWTGSWRVNQKNEIENWTSSSCSQIRSLRETQLYSSESSKPSSNAINTWLFVFYNLELATYCHYFNPTTHTSKINW